MSYSWATPLTIAHQDSPSMGFFQARMLGRVATSFFRGSSWSRDWACISWVSCTDRWILYHRATSEAHILTLTKLKILDTLPATLHYSLPRLWKDLPECSPALVFCFLFFFFLICKHKMFIWAAVGWDQCFAMTAWPLLHFLQYQEILKWPWAFWGLHSVES